MVALGASSVALMKRMVWVRVGEAYPNPPTATADRGCRVPWVFRSVSSTMRRQQKASISHAVLWKTGWPNLRRGWGGGGWLGWVANYVDGPLIFGFPLKISFFPRRKFFAFWRGAGAIKAFGAGGGGGSAWGWGGGGLQITPPPVKHNPARVPHIPFSVLLWGRLVPG